MAPVYAACRANPDIIAGKQNCVGYLGFLLFSVFSLTELATPLISRGY